MIDDDIIWDSTYESYRSSLEDEITSAAPTIAGVIPIDVVESLKKSLYKAKRHQDAHVADLKLKQESLDAYKALSWLTWYMAESCFNTNIQSQSIRAGLNALNSCLSNEASAACRLPELTLDLMEAMVQNELSGKELCEHGIAKNGIFLSFHAAVKSNTK